MEVDSEDDSVMQDDTQEIPNSEELFKNSPAEPNQSETDGSFAAGDSEADTSAAAADSEGPSDAETSDEGSDDEPDLAASNRRPLPTVITSDEGEETGLEDIDEDSENEQNEEPLPAPVVRGAKKPVMTLPPKKRTRDALAESGPASKKKPAETVTKPAKAKPASAKPASTNKAPIPKPPVTSKTGSSSKSVAVSNSKQASKVVREASPEARARGPAGSRKNAQEPGPVAPPSRTHGGKAMQFKTIGKSAHVSMSEKSDKKTKKKKYEPNYHRYIFAAFRQVYPVDGPDQHTVSTATMGIVNSFMNDMFERITNEAARLAKLNKSRTLGAREIRTATNLILPGALAKHAVAEGDKALHLYMLTEHERKRIKAANEKEKD